MDDFMTTRADYVKESIVNNARNNLVEAIGMVQQYYWLFRWLYRDDFKSVLNHLESMINDMLPVCDSFEFGTWIQVMNCRRLVLKADKLMRKYRQGWLLPDCSWIKRSPVGSVDPYVFARGYV